MNVPYTALHFAVYESAKKWLVGSLPAAAEAEAAGAGGSGGEPQQRLSSGAGPLLTAAAAQAGSAGGLAAAVVVEDEEEEEGLQVQLVAGGVAGGLAAAATTPLDVVKTRLQLEGLGSATRYNTSSVVSLACGVLCLRCEGTGWACLEGLCSEYPLSSALVPCLSASFTTNLLSPATLPPRCAAAGAAAHHGRRGSGCSVAGLAATGALPRPIGCAPAAACARFALLQG